MADFVQDERIVDPSPTTEARILSQVTAVEKVLDQKIMSVLVEIDGIKKAHEVFHEDLTRMPTAVDKAIVSLKELLQATFYERMKTMEEKFSTVHTMTSGIQLQFRERDTRAEQFKTANDIALKAALDAAKDSVLQQNMAFSREMIKSETLFTKQIDQLITMFSNGMKSTDEKIITGMKTSDDKIASVEKQLTLMIGRGAGQLSTQQEQHDSSGRTWQIVGVVCAVMIGVGAAIISIINLNWSKL